MGLKRKRLSVMLISTFDRTHDKVVCMYVCIYSTESILIVTVRSQNPCSFFF